MPGKPGRRVLRPRYTTYAGQDSSVTIAMDATEYSPAIVRVWMEGLIGTTPTIGITLEESSDQVERRVAES